MGEVDKKNGEILLGFRKQNRMTQAELGEILGRNFRDISKYEKGLLPIPQEVVTLLNKRFKLRLKSTNKKVKDYSIKEPQAIKISKPLIKKELSTFGKNLQELRMSLGLTQYEFGVLFGLDTSKVCRLEANKSKTLSIDSVKAFYASGCLGSLLS